MPEFKFFDRDISWLLFNGRVLQEARHETLPLLERIKFLSIFSSNLDEFYRVRMPFLLAKNHVEKKDKPTADSQKPDNQLLPAQQLIAGQLQMFGETLKELLPLLSQHQIYLLYGDEFPEGIKAIVTDYLFTQVMAFLQPKDLDSEQFFPENNKLYFLLNMQRQEIHRTVMLNIPSDQLPRFFTVSVDARLYIVFLDDIIRHNLGLIFKDYTITGCYSFKITRDAAIDFKDEYGGDYSKQIEKLILKRDAGLATRFLYQPEMPLHSLELIRNKLNLSSASLVEGGIYHNLKDLAELPVHREDLSILNWPGVKLLAVRQQHSLFNQVLEKDLIIHPPYQSYGTVLRFFNEAAVDENVEEISVTLYRVASDSKIVNALISAAKNGKKVLVIVELKARFDEANNIKWAKKMKEAGIRIVYSAMALKVHAKIALIKKRKANRIIYAGLLGTGNFNETTASFYTDHVLMTAHRGIMRELDLLFIFLSKGKKASTPDLVKFEYLLVSGFNLLEQFLGLIDREINAAKKGLPANITIKMNNLEEKVLISRLYEASQAGVKIVLIIRGICCLIPGAKGMSENITVRRIVDRYLEHGRVFIFHNQGKEEIYLGSADWMDRNIYRRIEVCFPVYDPKIRKEIREIIDLQLQDNVQAIMLDQELQNIPIKTSGISVQSQREIYLLLKNKTHEL